MQYTDRIVILDKIAKSLKRDDLVQQMKKLRKYSDIAELIGHPKNPSKGFGIFEQENKPFLNFRKNLAEVEETILKIFEVSGLEQFYKEKISPLFTPEKPNMTRVSEVAKEIQSLNIPGPMAPKNQ